MITSMEIRNHQFSKSLRGYNQDEVKNLLTVIAQDYETLYVENSQLKESMLRLEHELNRFKKMEETMNSSLIVAQQTADNIKSNAQREADVMVNDAKRRIAEIFLLYQDVTKRLNMFNSELKGQINGQLEMIDKNQKRVEELTNFFFGKDMKEIMESLEKADLKGNDDAADHKY